MAFGFSNLFPFFSSFPAQETSTKTKEQEEIQRDRSHAPSSSEPETQNSAMAPHLDGSGIILASEISQSHERELRLRNQQLVQEKNILEDQLKNVALYPDTSDHKLSMLGNQCRRREKELEDLQRTLSRKGHELRNSKHQVSSLQRKLQDCQDITILKEKNTALSKEIQACKDDLFRLQPTTQTPDSTIILDYDSLDQLISSWIDEEILRGEEKWKEGQVEHRVFFNSSGVHQFREFLRLHQDTGGEHLMHCLMHDHLQLTLFTDELLLFGMENLPIEKSIHTIEAFMAELQPPRG